MKVKPLSTLHQGRLERLGLSPYLISDALAIAPIQVGMIYKMNDAFGVKMKDSVATSLITGLLGFTPIGQTAKTIVANLIKCIPGVGSVVGAIISGTTATIITEGIGFAYLKVLKKCFNDETGEVKLPAMDTIESLFKESYISLDTIKKLKD